MAFPAVAHLMQFLEERVLRFSCIVLEIEKGKARGFLFEANKIIDEFSKLKSFKCIPSSRMRELKNVLEALAPAINHDIKDASPKTLTDIRRILTRIPGLVSEIDDMNSKLEAFLHKLNGGSVIVHPFAQQLSNDLLSSNKEFKRVFTFYNKVATEAISLHGLLSCLLSKLMDSNDDQVATCIKVAADKAGDSIEAFLKDNPFFLDEKVDHSDFDHSMKDTGQSLPLEEESNSVKEGNRDRIASAGDSKPEESLQVQGAADLLCSCTPEDTDIEDCKEDMGGEIAGYDCAEEFRKGSTTPLLLESKRSIFTLMEDMRQLMCENLVEVSKLESPEEPADRLCSIADGEDENKEDTGSGLPDSVLVDGHVSKIVDELITSIPKKLKLVRIEIEGLGSVEKASVARKVFQHPKIEYGFRMRAWVDCNSSSDKVPSDLLASFCPGVITKLMDRQDRGEILYRSLLPSRYLIVLDGPVSGVYEALAAIERYLPDKARSCRILTTSSIMDYPIPIINKTLSQGSPDQMKMVYDVDDLVDQQSQVVVGLDKYVGKITRQLLESTLATKVVTIVGKGGIGKTTLARKVISLGPILHHFAPVRWVDCESSTIHQCLSRLLDSITGSSKTGGESCVDIGEKLRKSLRNKTYLIVIDGLKNFEDWEAIRVYLPEDNVGSRILVTSRSMEFPSTTNLTIISMEPLNENSSWELLKKLLVRETKWSVPQDVVDMADVVKKIAEKCEGLPLAIVLIASVLSGIPDSYFAWLDVRDSVNSIVSTTPKHKLALSYSNLPHHLKACLLFMAAFPAKFKVQNITDLWLAEGFFNLEDHLAEDCLEDLIRQNLVTVISRGQDGKIKECRIDENLRQFCLQEAKRENFFRVIMDAADTTFQGLDMQRHLFLDMDYCDEIGKLPAELPHLRSFICLAPLADLTPDEVIVKLAGFKFMRVLDMHFMPLETFPEELLNLTDLRYLAVDLHYELGTSISQLSKLQTLIVNGLCNSLDGEENPTLSLELWKMPWLRHVNVEAPSRLRNSDTDNQGVDSAELPSSGSLEILSTVTFSSCTEQVFRLMPNLKKLGVAETRQDYEDDEPKRCFHNLSSLTQLHTLKCSFYKEGEIGEARRLGLNGLPMSLKKLTLTGSCLPWDEMASLALLPNLETLKLKDRAFQGPNWVLTEEDVFRSLKQLLIKNTDLTNWEVEDTDNFPCLEHLILRSCKLLESIPSGVGLLCTLELIEMHNCSESAEDSARSFQEQWGVPTVVIQS